MSGTVAGRLRGGDRQDLLSSMLTASDGGERTASGRAEGGAVLHGLLSCCGTIELAGDLVRGPRFNFRTYDRIPLAIRPA